VGVFAHSRQSVARGRFSGALEPPAAVNRNDYHLAAAGKDKKFGTRVDTRVILTTPMYDVSSHTVTLMPKGPVPDGPLQLTITAALELDAGGRPLDGDRDGQPGGDFHAVFKGAGISLSRIVAADVRKLTWPRF
jgi:hypothetical protein